MHRLCVLHRVPLDEADWLLTVFSRQSGKQFVVTPHRKQTRLELNSIYEAGWSDSDDWPRIYAVNCVKQSQLDGDALLCSLYLNELLVRLLNTGDSMPTVYDRYERTLEALAGGQHPEPWLRTFEYQLLMQLGYGFSWSSDCDGRPLDAQTRYDFEPERGLLPSRDGAYAAHWLLPLSGTGKPGAESWVCAKRILRQAIDHILDRPLQSRELFSWRNKDG